MFLIDLIVFCFQLFFILYQIILLYEYKYIWKHRNNRKKTLNIIDKFFPNIKINLLCANSNDILLLKQIKKFNPKYVHIFDKNKLSKLKRVYLKKKVLD